MVTPGGSTSPQAGATQPGDSQPSGSSKSQSLTSTSVMPPTNGALPFNSQIIFKAPAVPGKLFGGTIVHYKIVAGKILYTVRFNGDSSTELPGVEEQNVVGPWDKSYIQQGIPNPDSVYEHVGLFSEGEIVVGTPVGKQEYIAVHVTIVKQGTVIGTDAEGNTVEVNKLGAVKYSDKYFSHLKKPLDPREKEAENLLKGVDPKSHKRAASLALQVPWDEIPPPSEKRVKNMLTDYKYDIDNEEGMIQLLNRWSQVILEDGMTKRRFRRFRTETRVTYLKGSWADLKSRAYGICVSWGDGDTIERELGICPEYVKTLQTFANDFVKKDRKMTQDSEQVLRAMKTIVHENIHTWHPSGASKGERKDPINTEINEGITEWIARHRLEGFVRGTGLDKHFDEDIMKNDLRRIKEKGSYQWYVTCIDWLAKAITERGFNAMEVLTRIHLTGYAKDWTLLERVFNVPVSVIESNIQKVFKQATPPNQMFFNLTKKRLPTRRVQY